LMLTLWTLFPALLVIGLVVARKRYPEQLSSLGLIFTLLAVLQVIALLGLLKSRWRPLAPAFAAVLALWSTYIVVVEPLERSLYDTRTFTLAVKAKIAEQPAPVVLHGLGKDAKAIKFMVNFNCDKVPLFTQTTADLAPLQAPVWLVMSAQDFEKVQDPRLRALTPALSGEFDKDPYVLLHLVKAPAP